MAGIGDQGRKIAWRGASRYNTAIAMTNEHLAHRMHSVPGGSDPSVSDLLSVAIDAAYLAGRRTLAYFNTRLPVEIKADHTPVTQADREAEQVIRTCIARTFPDHAILGEEGGKTEGNPDYRWIIDPIDGTKNFVRGVPVWSTLVALSEGDPASDGEVVVGVVSAPALGRRWWAARGTGAWVAPAGIASAATGSASSFEPRRLTVSGVTSLADASLSFSGVGGWAERGRLPQFLELTAAVWRTRAYGDFWSHMLVAEGAVDVSAEPEVSLWDLAALAVIVEEAGGRFTDLDGVRGPAGGSAVATNAHLHDEVVHRLSIT